MDNWRGFALPVVLWVYGIAITVTLFSVWGRAVVIDRDLMASAAADTAAAGPVASRIEDWLARELRQLPALGPSGAERLAASAVADPSIETTLGELVRAVVLAASVPPGEEAVVEVAEILRPAVPALTTRINERGVMVDESVVGAYISSLDPLVVRQPEEMPPVGSRSGAARTLSLATVIGALTAFTSGVAAVQMAPDRRAMVRSLLHRLALGALGFAVMFRLGAWVLDPGAGRAPFRTAVARLAGAKLWLPVLISAGAAGVAWALRNRANSQRLTPAEGTPVPSGSPM